MASASDDAANGGYEKRARDCTTVFTVESTPIARTRRGKSAPRIRCTRTDGVVHGSCSREANTLRGSCALVFLFCDTRKTDSLALSEEPPQHLPSTSIRSERGCRSVAAIRHSIRTRTPRGVDDRPP